MPSIPFEPWELQSYDKSCSLADKSWLLFLFSERPKEVPPKINDFIKYENCHQ